MSYFAFLVFLFISCSLTIFIFNDDANSTSALVISAFVVWAADRSAFISRGEEND